MSEESETEEVTAEGTEAVEEAEDEEEAVTGEAVVDLDSTREYETTIEQLREQVEEQQEEIEELKDLMLDLSTRVADGRGMGVCPECHGPVQKVRRLLGATTIECRRCGEVFHEY